MRVPEIVPGYPDRILPREDLTENSSKSAR